MVDLLVSVLLPTIGFALFAGLAVRFGAESRAFFDERPVTDDRPNWFPIGGASVRAGDEEDDDVEVDGGDPEPVMPAVAARRPGRSPVQPAPRPATSLSSAATSPSGV